MANPLTYRQRAKMHQKQAAAYDRMARLQMQEANNAYAPLGATSTIADWKDVIALFEQAHAYDRESDSHGQQAAAYNALADEAGEPV